MSFERKTPTLSVKKAWTHEQFLSSLRGKQTWVTVGSGETEITRKGEIVSFDKYTILLRNETSDGILIFKNSISEIQEVTA